MSTSPQPQVTSAYNPSATTAATLASLLDPARLPTPPAVALRVAQAAARPDCRPAEIAALLGHDPALCAKLLKTVNSCVYGLPRPVSSLTRAVTVLGMQAVRSLALGLSLPVLKARGTSTQAMRDYWVGSVGGAIIARELTTRARLSGPEDMLVAGLLRDLGQLFLRDMSPGEWEAMAARDRTKLISDPCGAEQEAFGVSHADISAELLLRWNLPEMIVEPVRCHHDPDRLSASPTLGKYAAVLSLASSLTMLDAVADLPDELARVLALADECFGLSGQDLVEFLQGIAPKVEAFAKLLDQDIGHCPDFAAILTAATQELAKLNGDPAAKSGPRDAVIPLRRTNLWPQ